MTNYERRRLVADAFGIGGFNRTGTGAHDVRMIDNGVEPCCSECDCRHSYDDEPKFCMGCGARVVE